MPIRQALIAAACCIAATGLGGPANAAERAPRVEVSYDDLDLTREADVRTLERRIVRAARRLCEKIDEVSFVWSRSRQKCVRHVIQDNTHLVQIAVNRAETARALAAR